MSANWHSILSTISSNAPGISAKLRLTPCEGGVVRLAAHHATLRFAEELESKGYTVVAIEPRLEEGYAMEADLVAKLGEGALTYYDVTTSTDETVLNLKRQKAAQMSASTGYDRVVIQRERVDIGDIDYGCKFSGELSHIFKILEGSLRKNPNRALIAERRETLLNVIANDVAKSARITVDKRWAKISNDNLADNSPIAVSYTLDALKAAIPESAEFIGKLSAMAALSKEKLFSVKPAALASDTKESFVSALHILPSEPGFFSISNDFTVSKYNGVTNIKFVTDPSTLAIAKRKFDKDSKTYSKVRFIIIFNRSFIPEGLANSIERTTNKCKAKDSTSTMFKDLAAESDVYIKQALHSHEAMIYALTSTMDYSEGRPVDIFTKINTLSLVDTDTSEADINSIHTKSREFTTTISSILSDTIGAAIYAHEYEIAKTVIAASTTSSKKNEYHLGRNGSFDSYTIVKCTGTQDSFKVAPYFVIYKEASTPDQINPYCSSEFKITSHTYTNCRFHTKNTLNWAVKLPLVLLNLVAWHVEQTKDFDLYNLSISRDIMGSCMIYARLNRDPFAQVADLTRYWYGSSIGEYSEISGLFKKYDTFVPKYKAECVYIARQLKMAAALRSISVQKKFGLQSYDSQGSPAYNIAMPHCSTPVAENSAIISMFYLSNIFNKYKYNVEVSSAICYLQLIEERNIYNACNKSYMLGISPDNMDISSIHDLYESDERFTREVEFMREVMLSSNKRFNCSLLATYIFSISYTPEVNTELLFARLSRSPTEALTLRGGMSSGDVSDKPQSVRAASCMIEGILEAYGESPIEFNESLLSKYAIMSRVKNADTSILGLKNLQFASGKQYAYRVVHKDQKGHREISVLNYDMRIGTMFVETIFKFIAKDDDTDLLQNTDKLRAVQKHIRGLDFVNSKVFFDNTDQSRWGPNALMHHFGSVAIAIFADHAGLSRLILDTLCDMTNKQAKIPDCLISLVKAGHTRFSKISAVGQVMDVILPMISEKSYAILMSPGMGQGILHQTSSSMHVIKNYARSAVVRKLVPTAVIKDNTTSDDNLAAVSNKKGSVIELPMDTDDDKSTSEVKTAVSSNNAVSLETVYYRSNTFLDKIFNIIRNTSKSFISRQLADFNSNFFLNECLAVPSLKQRVSYIDCGDGEDFVEDSLKACSTGASYLAAGGSYVGAIMLTLSNMTLVFEQHRCWFRLSSENRPINTRSIFAMGIPVIEPVITMMYGPIINAVLRERFVTGLDHKIILNALLTNLANPATTVSQMEVTRGSSSVSKEDFRYLMPTNISGLVSLSRPSRLQTRFMKRHKLGMLTLTDDDVHYNKSYPSFANFIFTATLGVGSKLKEDNLGVNNFLLRLSEPWIGLDKIKIRRSNTIMAKALFKREVMSIKMLESECAAFTNGHIIAAYEASSKNKISEFASIIATTMLEFATPAETLYAKLRTIFCKVANKYKGIPYSNAIIKLPHKVAGETSDIRKTLVKLLYKGSAIKYFGVMPNITFGPIVESMLKAVAVDSLKDAITSADLLYNSITKFTRSATFAIVKSNADYVRYENLASILIGRMFTATKPIELNLSSPELTAPVTYISLNKAVTERFAEVRDMVSRESVASFLTNSEFTVYPDVYLESSNEVIQSVQAVARFVKYDTGVKFKMCSETFRSFSQELSSLVGFAGDINITKNFFRALARGVLGATAYEIYPNSRVKFLDAMALPERTIEGYPYAVVSTKLEDSYISNLIVLAPREALSARIDTNMIARNKWNSNLLEFMSSEFKDGTTKVLKMHKRSNKPIDEVKVTFITENTSFKLETSRFGTSFGISARGLILPFKSAITYNREVIRQNIASFNWPEVKLSADKNIEPMKGFFREITVRAAREGPKIIEPLIEAANRLDIPTTKKGLDRFLAGSIITKNGEVKLKALAEKWNALEIMYEDTEMTGAMLIVAVKSCSHEIKIRKSTLSRTLCHIGNISTEAPLFTYRESKVSASKVAVLDKVKSSAVDISSMFAVEEEDADLYQSADDTESEEDEADIAMRALLASQAAKHLAEVKIEAKADEDAVGTVFEDDALEVINPDNPEVEEEPLYVSQLVDTSSLSDAILESFSAFANAHLVSVLGADYSIWSSTQFASSDFLEDELDLWDLLMSVNDHMGACQFVLSLAI